MEVSPDTSRVVYVAIDHVIVTAGQCGRKVLFVQDAGDVKYMKITEIL